MISYCICSIKSFYLDILIEKLKKKYNESINWIIINDNNEFKNKIFEYEVNKIFFIHWPYIIPMKIYNSIECINFHTSNLPEDRGGSPIQNQIIKNVILSKVNALRVTDDGLDKGPCYISYPINLSGNFVDIFLSIIEISYVLISKIIDENLKPIYHNYDNNDIEINKRIKDNNLIIKDKNILEIYNQIRMRDSDYYQRTYIEIENYKFSFKRANIENNIILSDCIIEYIKK